MAENSWDLWDSYPVTFASFAESTDNQNIILDVLQLTFSQLSPTITAGAVNISTNALTYTYSILTPSISGSGQGDNNQIANSRSFAANARMVKNKLTFKRTRRI